MQFQITEVFRSARRRLATLLLLLESAAFREEKRTGCLNVKRQALKTQASHRCQEVNQGRPATTLVAPNGPFQLQISLLPKKEKGRPRCRVDTECSCEPPDT